MCNKADASGRAVHGVGLRALTCWDCGVRNPPGAWMSASCGCWEFSGRDFCFGLITRPVGFYRVWCV